MVSTGGVFGAPFAPSVDVVFILRIHFLIFIGILNHEQIGFDTAICEIFLGIFMHLVVKATICIVDI